MEDELIDFAEEVEQPAVQVTRTWRVLIVDDEPDVHASTKLAVGDMLVLGRPIEFLHAYSGREGLIYGAEKHAESHGRRALELELRQDLAMDSLVRSQFVELCRSTLLPSEGGVSKRALVSN